MQKIRKLLSILVSLVMILSVFTMVPLFVNAATAPIPYVNAAGKSDPAVLFRASGNAEPIVKKCYVSLQNMSLEGSS